MGDIVRGEAHERGEPELLLVGDAEVPVLCSIRS
jgi:hypothetical protein